MPTTKREDALVLFIPPLKVALEKASICCCVRETVCERVHKSKDGGDKGEKEEQMLFVGKEVEHCKKSESMRRKRFAIPNQVGVTG